MNIALTPEDAALVDQKVRSGEYSNREAVVAHALSLLRGSTHKTVQSPSDRHAARALRELFEEIDGEPPSEAGTLSDEALSRDSFYDTERTRV